MVGLGLRLGRDACLPCSSGAHVAPGQLISHGADLDHISRYTPFLEADRTWEGSAVAEPVHANHQRLGWRAFNTHLLPAMLPAAAAARSTPARASEPHTGAPWRPIRARPRPSLFWLRGAILGAQSST